MRIRTVTNGDWSVSTISGGGRKGYEISVCRFRDGHRKMQRGQLNGLVVATSEEATRLCLLYGYTQPYSRNSCGFVMSRAARRRGLKTADWRYNNCAASVAQRFPKGQ